MYLRYTHIHATLLSVMKEKFSPKEAAKGFIERRFRIHELPLAGIYGTSWGSYYAFGEHIQAVQSAERGLIYAGSFALYVTICSELLIPAIRKTRKVVTNLIEKNKKLK